MNLKRGFFRLTLILSLLAAVIVPVVAWKGRTWYAWDATLPNLALYFCVPFLAVWVLYALIRYVVVGYIGSGSKRERAPAERKRGLVRIIPPLAIIILICAGVFLLPAQRYDIVMKNGERCKLDRLTGKLTPLKYIPTEGTEIAAERWGLLTKYVLWLRKQEANSIDWKKAESTLPELDLDAIRTKMADRTDTSASTATEGQPTRVLSPEDWEAHQSKRVPRTYEEILGDVLLEQYLKEEFR